MLSMTPTEVQFYPSCARYGTDRKCFEKLGKLPDVHIVFGILAVVGHADADPYPYALT